ncbi:MAG: hypothetical protein V3U59_00505 [Gammaproteobacteria bacterium]
MSEYNDIRTEFPAGGVTLIHLDRPEGITAFFEKRPAVFKGK